MKKIKKTNAARILDDLKIQYELKTYPVGRSCGKGSWHAAGTGV